MTAPSALLGTVVSTLRTALGSGVLDVRDSGGEFLAVGGKDEFAAKSPGVLVACIGMPSEVEFDTGPACMHMLFVAACHARAPKLVDAQMKEASNVALDLAGSVAAIVHKQRWGGLAQGPARRLRLSNEFDRELKQKGVYVWLVTWLQAIELDAALNAPTLVALTSIHHTFGMGPEGVGPPNDDPESIVETV